MLGAILKTLPNQVTALLYRGASLVALKRYPEGLRDLNRAFQISPNDPDLYYYRGQAYAGMGDRERATRDFQKCLRLEPESEWKGKIETFLEEHSK